MRNKKLNYVISMVMLSMTTHLHAAIESCDLHDQTVDTLFCVGSAHLQQVNVTHLLKVIGHLTVDNSSAGSINSIGSTNLTNTKVAAEISVIGSLVATESSFYGPMRLINSDTKFSAVQASGVITIDYTQQTPYLYILDNSKVNSVSFNSLPGIVVLQCGSTVSNVTNGKIIKEDVC